MKTGKVCFCFPSGRRWVLLIAVLFLLGHAAPSQNVSVRLLAPPPFSLHLEDLTNVMLTHAGHEPVTVVAQGTATDLRRGVVAARVETQPFVLYPGVNTFTAANVPRRASTYIAPEYQYLETSNSFGPGFWEICIAIRSADSADPLGSDCMQQEVEAPQIRLILPKDGAQVHQPNPVLQWLNTHPLNESETYTVRVVKKMYGQNAAEAIHNIDHARLEGLYTAMSQYPVGAQELTPGDYCWQVTLSVNNYPLATSPIGEFTVPGPSKIVGYKFHDLNGNGVWEGYPATPWIPGKEPGLQGWTFNLNGPETQTATTDASGRFEFVVRSPGAYTVGEQQQPGWLATTPASQEVVLHFVPGETLPTAPELLFGNRVDTIVTPRECVVSSKTDPGTPISVSIVTPRIPTDSSTSKPIIPLTVLAEDMDLEIQKCLCTTSEEQNPYAEKQVKIVDPIRYEWTPPGHGKLYAAGGPANLYEPPDLEVGRSVRVNIRCYIKDNAANDGPAWAHFEIQVVRTKECHYRFTVMATHSSENNTPTVPGGFSQLCRPEKEDWNAQPAMSANTPSEIRICAREKIILTASGSDQDELKLVCQGDCGNDEKKMPKDDELVYSWHTTIGRFAGQGVSATTTGWNTSVVFEAPDAGGEGTITLKINDSGKQAADGEITRVIPVKIGKVDLVFEDVSEEEEACEGAYMCLNCDDDNEKNTIDKGESGTVEHENDLLKIQLTQTLTNGEIIFEASTGGSKIKIWKNETKGQEVILPKTYKASDLPQTLWIEGINTSDKPKDIELVLRSDGPQCDDRAKLTVMRVDLDADASRNGAIEDDEDDTAEEKWERGKDKRGAVILANCDDDEERGAKDNKPDNWPGDDLDGDGTNDPADTKVNGTMDLNDIGPLWAHKLGIDPLPDDLKIVLSVKKVPGENTYFNNVDVNHRIRIFLPTKQNGNDWEIQDGDLEIIGPTSGGAAIADAKFLKTPNPKNKNERSYDIFKGKGMVKFGIEGIKFNASVLVTLEVFKGEKSLCKDEVHIRVAPFIAFSHKSDIDQGTQSAQSAVYIDDNYLWIPHDNSDLRNHLRTDYVPPRLAEITISDTWFQDHFEIGYTQTPYGSIHVILGLSRLIARGREAFNIAREQILRNSVGLIADKYKGNQFYKLAFNDQCDGGNFEVQPKGAFGEIVIGKGQWGEMNAEVIEFLKAQEIQSIVSDVDITWLVLGHLDETVSFPTSSSQRTLVASPEAAWALLTITKNKYGGGATRILDKMVPHPSASVSVDNVLDTTDGIDDDLRKDNFNIPNGYSEKMLLVRKKLGLTPTVSAPITKKGGAKLRRAGYLEAYNDEEKALDWQLVFTDDNGNFSVKAGFKDKGKGTTNEDFISDKQLVYILKDWWGGAKPKKGDEITFTTKPSPDMIELPVLFYNTGLGAFSYTNNVVNAIVDGNTIFVPKIHGPEVLPNAPKDILEDYVQKASRKAGFKNIISNDDRAYHNSGGSIHCGTNVCRKIPLDKTWWQY